MFLGILREYYRLTLRAYGASLAAAGRRVQGYPSVLPPVHLQRKEGKS